MNGKYSEKIIKRTSHNDHQSMSENKQETKVKFKYWPMIYNYPQQSTIDYLPMYLISKSGMVCVGECMKSVCNICVVWV